MEAIYCIENKITGDRYVGSSVNFYKRKKLHLKRLKNKEHHSPHLQNAWNKYGEENFVFIILEKFISRTDLINREQWWINNSNSEYNICKTAGSSLGVKRSEKTKEKIKKANLGLKHPEWRNKIKSEAQGGDKHWTKNKKFSEESKENMSKAQKNLFKNGYVHPRKGKSETIEQILLKIKRISKPIIQYDLEENFIKEWESAKQASINGFIASNISECCKNKRKTHKKFIWKYKEK